jgi:hypothetical protein
MVISVKNNTTAKPIPNETGVLLTMPFMARARDDGSKRKESEDPLHLSYDGKLPFHSRCFIFH